MYAYIINMQFAIKAHIRMQPIYKQNDLLVFQT